MPSARGIALAAGADLTRPVLVVDIGAHLTVVVLLGDGDVTDTRRTALGTGDLDGTTPRAARRSGGRGGRGAGGR